MSPVRRGIGGCVVVTLWMASGCGVALEDMDDEGQVAEITEALYTDDTPPPLAGTLSATVEGCGRVLLRWPNVLWPSTPEPDESGLRTYRVYQDKALVAETRGTPLFEFSSERHYVRTGLLPGRTYTFGVSAVDEAGNESPRLQTSVTTPSSSHVRCVDTTPPNKPTLVKLDETSQGRRACGRLVRLEMSASDAANWWNPWTASGIAYYNVYRNARFMSRVTNGFYEQYLGQYPGNTYTYTVTAVDHAGNESAFSNAIVHQVPADCRMNRPATQTVRLLVLPVRPLDGPPDPFPASQVYDFVRGGSTFPNFTVRDYFTENSYGRLNLAVTAASPNWITLPEKTMVSGGTGYCTTRAVQNWGYSCNHQKMLPQALALTGHDPNDYDMFLFVKNGMTDQFSNHTYASVHVLGGINSAYNVTLHELSHQLGGSMEHSGGNWFCPGRSAGNGFSNLTGLDIYDLHFGCNAIRPQGDPLSVLGSSSPYPLPMFNRWLKGFLTPAQTVVASEGTSEIVLYSAESGSLGNVVRHVVVPFVTCGGLTNDTPFFSVEYRTAGRFNDDPESTSFLAGVQIRLAPWNGVYEGAAETVYLGTLRPEGTTVFSYQQRSITLLEANGTSARIRVQRPRCWLVNPGGPKLPTVGAN